MATLTPGGVGQGAETAKASTPTREASLLEDRLAAAETFIAQAHATVDRMLLRDSAKADERSVGVLSAASRINDDLGLLCERLDYVADRVGLL